MPKILSYPTRPDSSGIAALALANCMGAAIRTNSGPFHHDKRTLPFSPKNKTIQRLFKDLNIHTIYLLTRTDKHFQKQQTC